ncbi:MAG: hypothetical protein H8E38_07665 [SAR324 cluster bacterium]|nr:hypothetical protein [SAR324 cluster bacterium]MBL7034538.1 hypothetical protein [SAR324 cluster bacterium]
MKNLKIITICLVALATSACVNIVRYERSEDRIKPLQTTIKRIIIHEDYINSESDYLGLKAYFFKALVKRLSTIYDQQLIVIKSGKPFPTLVDNRGSLWIVGDIWSKQTKQSGRSVQLKTLSSRTSNSSSSRDVLEHLSWKEDSVMSYTNLYFIELTENPKLLRSTITASNFTAVRVSGDRGTEQSSIMTEVEFQNPDDQAESFFSGAATDKRLAAGYQLVSLALNKNNWQASLNQLAETAVSKHFSGEQ